MSVRCHIWPFLERCRGGTSTQGRMGNVLHAKPFLESRLAPKFPQSTSSSEPLLCETRCMCSKRDSVESASPITRCLCHLRTLSLGSCKARRSISRFWTDARFLCGHADHHVVRRPGNVGRSKAAWVDKSAMADCWIRMDLFRYDFAGSRLRGRLCQARSRHFISSASVLSYIYRVRSVGPKDVI